MGGAEASATESYAIAMHGAPALPADFTHMPYANPDAPKGGRLVEGLLGTFDSLNPLIVRGVAVQQIVAAQPMRGLVIESLLARGNDEPFTLYGLLARSVETDDARSYVTFRLDPRARFSDGKPVTAADVLFSWALLRDHGRPNHRQYYSKVAKAEAIDPLTVRFDLTGANDRELPLILGLMPILPKHAIDASSFEDTTMTPLVTWSKYLDQSEGPEGWTQGQAQSVQNWYDTTLEKSLMIDDIPRSFVASYIYELPVGKGKALQPQSKFVNAVVGGWQVSGITTLKDGFPLAFTNATNNANSFGGGQRPNLAADPGLSNPSIYEWFNTAAFAQPAPFTFGDLPRTTGYLRSQGTINTDASLQKYWQLWNESSKLQFRAEAYNLFNRAQFFAPTPRSARPVSARCRAHWRARSIQLG